MYLQKQNHFRSRNCSIYMSNSIKIYLRKRNRFRSCTCPTGAIQKRDLLTRMKPESTNNNDKHETNIKRDYIITVRQRRRTLTQHNQ